jgi:hypothetical protein
MRCAGIKCFLVIAALSFVPVCVSAQFRLSSDDKKIIADFELRTKRYVDLRNKARAKLPKLSESATPEEIEAHQTALRNAVLAWRVNARQGALFTQSATVLIRNIIKSEFKGYEGAEIRQAVFEADTKGVPIKVNVVYPESKELVEMSPALLLTLPQLPKELRYRYIGRSLVLMDRDVGIIIDFMKDALP